MNVAGNWTYSGGTFNHNNGTVTFNGAGTQNLTANVATTFNHLTVNAGATLVETVAADNVAVAGTLTNNGTLQRTQDVNGSSNVSFFNTGGYGGLTLNANGSNLGSTTVNIKGNQDCTTTAGETVKRCFNIAPTNTSSRNATITFYFADSELSGNTCSTLDAFRNTGGNNWSQLTRDGSYGTNGRDCSNTPRSLRVVGVSDFSPFVLKSGAPTAITLQAFRARTVDGWVYAGVVLALLLFLGGGLALRQQRFGQRRRS
jgi:hypothetical protein